MASLTWRCCHVVVASNGVLVVTMGCPRCVEIEGGGGVGRVERVEMV